MAKATTTIRQTVNQRPGHEAWFAAHQALFNRVASLYFEVALAHESVLTLRQQEALTALERLTHATAKNPLPVLPLSAIAEHIPALFRRAAIHAALGSARSFATHLQHWRARKEKALATGRPFTQRPPVPPRSWQKAATFYAGQWKERTASSIMLKVWTGGCWSWIKVRISGRAIPADVALGSPQLVRQGDHWWLHTPIERQFKSPGTIEQQVTAQPETKICAIDLNLNEHLAVCTIQTVDGTILATSFIGGGRRVAGRRKSLLGRISRNRRQTGLIAKGEQDNADRWRKIRHVDEQVAHRISARLVQFAQAHAATILVFEHLGKLKPTKGSYSKRGNAKRAFWMKGRIFTYSKYKAYNAGILTSRINPRNTSRECARCQSQVARYAEGHPAEGYTMGAPLVACAACGMQGHADRNASLVIGHRLVRRYAKPDKSDKAKKREKEKPHTLRRGEKSPGVVVCQDAENVGIQPSTGDGRHADHHEHGTAQERKLRMGEPLSDIAH